MLVDFGVPAGLSTVYATSARTGATLYIVKHLKAAICIYGAASAPLGAVPFYFFPASVLGGRGQCRLQVVGLSALRNTLMALPCVHSNLVH